MIDFTPIARSIFSRRARKLRDYSSFSVEEMQMGTLSALVRRLSRTRYGSRYGITDDCSATEFRRRLPLVQYEDIRQEVMRAVSGEKDVLWPGRCKRFAQSSGTSGGKSKYIPITDRALKMNHFVGASDSLISYLDHNPGSKIFSGKAFILGGSYANALSLPPGVHVGDLSASLIDCINPVANLFRIPDKKIALMEDWNEKLPRLVDAAARADVTNISGVPSWFLTVLKEVTAHAGAKTIHEVWPNLEVFFHGGIAFDPYRSQYRELTDPQKMHYVENYNASEGFFAFQDDPASPGMLLLLDRDIFYEFIPLDSLDTPRPETLTAAEVEQGKTYALVISSSCGLWRYIIGDTVRIHSLCPLRITVAGRTKSFINAFGEELMVYNAERAIDRACRICGCSVANYTAAPLFADNRHKGCHQWLIEWNNPPADIDRFADALDDCLQEENSDYQAKRQGSIFLNPPQIITARPGLFDRWLASTGKLGGQRKIPRLNNDRSLIDSLLQLNH